MSLLVGMESYCDVPCGVSSRGAHSSDMKYSHPVTGASVYYVARMKLCYDVGYPSGGRLEVVIILFEHIEPVGVENASNSQVSGSMWIVLHPFAKISECGISGKVGAVVNVRYRFSIGSLADGVTGWHVRPTSSASGATCSRACPLEKTHTTCLIVSGT